MNYRQKFENIVKKNNSLVCVGLDPEVDKFPTSFKNKQNSIFEFNKFVIDSTHDVVCAYKPNIAFYEAYGVEGLLELKKTLEYLQKVYPEVPIILDAKRGDIGNTARMYAKAVFEYWGADAVTIYPYLGLDACKPFFEYKDKCTFLLTRTSNPDATMFQDLKVAGKPFYLAMSEKIATWEYDNLGIFVGATYPEDLGLMRKLFPDSSFLSAGIGAQAAQTKKAVQLGIDKQKSGIAFNASRSIIYSSDPQAEAIRLRDEINKYKEGAQSMSF